MRSILHIMACPLAVPCRMLAIGGALMALAGAWPQPAGAAGWRSSVVLTTDYVFRGVSQTNSDPALQASLAYWNPTGWYAGAWGSNVDTARRYYAGSGADSELNLFLGYGRRLGADWVIDAKAVGYLYPDDPAPVNYDYVEFAFSAAWRERLYGSLAVSPRSTLLAYTGGTRHRATFAAELSVQQPLSPWVTWMLGAGYHEIAAPSVAGYFYGSTSVALQLKRVTFELGHYRTDADGKRLFGAGLAGDRTVLTAMVNLF